MTFKPEQWRLSDQSEAELIQAAGDETAAWWAIGRVAMREVDNRPEGVAMGTVRNAVADKAGCSAETVRKREEAARFWPAEVVEDYPALYVRHFAAAMRHTVTSSPLRHARRRLDVVAASADNYGGMPMPVRVLEAKLAAKYGDNEPMTQPRLHDELDHLVTRAAALAQRRGMPPQVAARLQKAIVELRQAMTEAQGPAEYAGAGDCMTGDPRWLEYNRRQVASQAA